MMAGHTIIRDDRGAAALEFAFAVPIIFSMMIGMVELGKLFYANAGVKNAVAEGARLASIYPYPGETAVKAAVTGSNFGLKSTNIVGQPTVVQRKDADDNDVVDISLNYRVSLDFKFFTTSPVILSHTRTVFLQTGTEPTAPTPTAPTSPTTPTTEPCVKNNGKPC